MCRIVSLAVMTIGSLLLTFGSFEPGEITLRLGFTFLGAGAVCFLRREMTASKVDLERARQSGYDDGYEDGASLARVVVVKTFGQSPDSGAGLPNSGTAKQLAQQGDVRG